MRAIFVWLAWLFTISVAVIIGYLWLDRPIALWIHPILHRQDQEILTPLSRIPNPLVILAVIVFVVLGFQAFIGRVFSKFETAAFIGSISIIVTETVKDELKFFFGRTWPETFNGNPSFIRDGVYGFNFLHGGPGYQSFPSGHMAAVCAVTAVFWIYYSRLRWAYTLGCIAVAASLVGANSHFLSDVVAGAFVGVSIGWMATTTWKAQRGISPS